MDILLYLIPVALVLGLVGLAGFVWSLKSGQYDDLDGAAQRILIDDAPPAGDDAMSDRTAEAPAQGDVQAESESRSKSKGNGKG